MLNYLKNADQHRVCMVANATIDVVCFGRATNRRVLGLLGRPLCLQFKAVGLQMPLIFAIISMERFSYAVM